MPDSLFHIPPFLFCEHCGLPIVVNEPPVMEYFEGSAGICPAIKCAKPINWWDCILASVKKRFMLGPFAGLGAKTKVFTILLKPERPYSISFAVHQIPSTAKILLVNYTPQGGQSFPARNSREYTSSPLHPQSDHALASANRFPSL